MSKLSKKIARIQRREGGGFGFGAAQREQPRAMLLGVVVADAQSAGRSEAADVVIVRAKDAAGIISAAIDSNATVGAWVDELSEASAESLHKANCDFVVSTLSGTVAAAVDTERMGQVLAPEQALDDTTLRALGPLGLDAILIDIDAAKMTLRQQLELVRVASFASTPLIVGVPIDADVSLLRVLRDSGTAIVLAPEGANPEELTKLGNRLREVPSSRRGRENGRDIALVPASTAHHDENDDEPEEI